MSRPVRILTRLLALLVLAATLRAQERIPPAPQNHFNDYADVISPAVEQALNGRLAEFERESSNQLVVAIFPRMESDSSVEDYTVRVAQAWGVGTSERRNGAVLFAFMEQRQLYIQVGYGLEGVLPDARCNQIIEDEIVPRMRAGDPDAAFRAGVEAMIAAARGEYTGTGRTVAERGSSSGRGGRGLGIGFTVLVIIVMSVVRTLRRGSMYHPRGRRTVWMGGAPWIGGPGRRGGGGFGGFGGGGTFSGGGGGFGGGGAGGRW